MRVAPEAPARAARAYLDGTSVLATRFETATGSLRLLDFMAIAGEDDLGRRAFPEHELGLPVLPAFHPRMARPHAGPTTERRLEPPGSLGRNYGWSTSLVLVLAHVVFGAILGLGAALAR